MMSLQNVHGIWSSTCKRKMAGRLKASLERLQRLTQGYADAMIGIFPSRASQLGKALGLEEERVSVSHSCPIRI
jgi:hypothetical protein